MAVPSSLHDFIIAALKKDLRLDGRRPFDSRLLNIKFSREDGGAEVQLGQTHVLSVVSCQLVAPFPDRPNEGSLAVFTEFSPMADPAFEPRRQGEGAVELGRIIDRGLRESRAVDTESLCIISGKAVWALRIDICILDNGGNLIDAACIAALAALLSFRRPDCSIEGGEVVVHPPEVREPLSLILHHLPISMTFAFFGDGDLVVLDPSYNEELVMKGKLTVTMNVHGDICAMQKGGGIGVHSSEILRCLRIASAKVAEVTATLKKAVETREIERAQRKIKRHKNVLAVEGIQYDISDDIKRNTEMMRVSTVENHTGLKEGTAEGLKPDVAMMNDIEKSSDSDSDNEMEVGEIVSVEKKLKQVEKSPKVGLRNDMFFEGGVSKWEDVEQSSGASAISSGIADGFLNQVSAAISDMGKPRSLQDAVKKRKDRRKETK